MARGWSTILRNPARHARGAGAWIALSCALLVTVACGSTGVTDDSTRRSVREQTTQPAQLAFGVDMARRGLWSEALFRFRQAERLAPGDAEVLNNIAVSYEALGDFDRALETYRRALKADSQNSTLRQNYSRFVEFYRAFRPDEAVEGAN
ncbi:MAG: tetratricopeptide repeat protein [Acidobacteriota bacterium]